MPNDTLFLLKEIIDSGMYAGFAAFAHYLYMYQKGSIAFKFSSLVIAVILGMFCGNIVDAVIPNEFSYQLWIFTINKTAISCMAGFMYKLVLDSVEKYQHAAVSTIFKTSTDIKKITKIK